MKILLSPFSFRGRGYLGNIYRPYINVEISTKTIDEWIPIEMLVDTGADYTLLPKRYVEFLSVDLARSCKPEKTYGIGGKESIYLCKKEVLIRIGNFQKTIPVGFLARNDVPPLLGRLGALEVIKLVMEKRTTIFER